MKILNLKWYLNLQYTKNEANGQDKLHFCVSTE